MALPAIALLIVLVILLIVAYQYYTEFSKDPQTQWLLGASMVAVLYGAYLVFGDFQVAVGSRQYPEFVKMAARDI